MTSFKQLEFNKAFDVFENNFLERLFSSLLVKDFSLQYASFKK